MCAPEPTLPASRSGANVARRPPRRATSRTTSLVTTLRSAAATPSAGATGTSNWCSPYSGRKSSGSDAGGTERRHRLRRERLGAPLRLERHRRRRRPVVLEHELVLEGRAHAQPGMSLQPLERAPQERATAAVPVAAVDLSDVAEHEMQRRDPGPLVDAHARGGIGSAA